VFRCPKCARPALASRLTMSLALVSLFPFKQKSARWQKVLLNVMAKDRSKADEFK
jgi:hypothetical protein